MDPDNDTQDPTQIDLTQTDPTASDAPAVSSGEMLINMESMIKNYMASIDKLQQESRKLKEMLDDIFNNDPTYNEHNEKAKEASKVKAQTRGEILKRAQPKELDDKIKTMKSELKESQGALSDYLQEYQRMSGVNEIEGDDGDIREIVYTAKLIRKQLNFK